MYNQTMIGIYFLYDFACLPERFGTVTTVLVMGNAVNTGWLDGCMHSTDLVFSIVVRLACIDSDHRDCPVF